MPEKYWNELDKKIDNALIRNRGDAIITILQDTTINNIDPAFITALKAIFGEDVVKVTGMRAVLMASELETLYKQGKKVVSAKQ